MDELNDYYVALKKRIVEQCAMMAKHDRAYALWAWRQYIEAMPWLELDKLKKAQPNERDTNNQLT